MKSSTPLRDITASARTGLSGNWGKAILILGVYSVISQGLGLLPSGEGLFSGWLALMPSILGFIAIFFCGPLQTGLATFFLVTVSGGYPRISHLFAGFNFFGKSVGAYFLMILFILLWSLLFVIPGIIKTYSYAMTFFIIADDPTVGALEAITRSRKLMAGNKWRLVCLYFRFFGWGLLCLLTLGIGFLWLWPYMMTSMAAFYEDVKTIEILEN